METTDDINSTSTNEDKTESTIDVMMLLSTVIASVGIISNLTVVVVFLKHKKMRRKIPNIFIINQVRDPLKYIYHQLIVIVKKTIHYRKNIYEIIRT